MQHDTGSQRLTLKRGANGVWQMVPPRPPLPEQTPPSTGHARSDPRDSFHAAGRREWRILDVQPENELGRRNL